MLQMALLTGFPVILYVKGALSFLDKNAVAIVGSRRASVYGLSVAEKFAMDLSDFGITVVSGLARGIDASAHRGALRAKGRTLAVLGSGLACMYPAENKKLFDQIVLNGAVLSEFPMETKPLACNFPRRNRIVSGLSLGVVVVEAAKRSGALITSDLALDQGKEVFAVPGKVNTSTAQGVNNLIKQGAKLVSCVDDVIEELGLELKRNLSASKEEETKEGINPNIGLTGDKKDVFSLLSSKPIHIDVLSEKTEFSISKLSSILLRLELNRLIKQLPGKLFVRI